MGEGLLKRAIVCLLVCLIVCFSEEDESHGLVVTPDEQARDDKLTWQALNEIARPPLVHFVLL